MAADGVTGGIGVLAGIAGGWLTAWYAYKGKIDSLKQERFAERERSFDVAKGGYRELQRKFAAHYRAALRGDDGIDELLADFEEAQAVGFTPLNAALERFWPVKQRLHAGQPIEDEWRGVEVAFETLAGLTLRDWERTMQDSRGVLARLRRSSA